MGGFPPGGTDATTASMSGLLHLMAGAIGFVSLAVAAVVVGTWFRREGRRGAAITSFVAAAVIVLGFVGGAALAMVPAGVGLLWLAVLAGLGVARDRVAHRLPDGAEPRPVIGARRPVPSPGGGVVIALSAISAQRRMSEGRGSMQTSGCDAERGFGVAPGGTLLVSRLHLVPLGEPCSENSCSAI